MPVDDQERGILIPEWKKPEPELEFTPNQKSRNIFARKDPLRVMPRDKSKPVHQKPATQAAILRVYPDGIEVGTSMAGGGRYFGLFGIALSVIPLGAIYASLELREEFGLFSIVLALIAIPFFLLDLLLIRRALFSPLDFPVMFNRKTGEVHIIPDKWPSYFKFWEKGAKGGVRSYRWEHVTARTYRHIIVTGKLAGTETTLQMLCSTAERASVVDEMVSLGVDGGWSDNGQAALWEHIRRYMEEGGPPLQPGDRLRKINLDKVPEFPPEIVAAAGGPALSEAELAKWTRAGVSASA